MKQKGIHGWGPVGLLIAAGFVSACRSDSGAAGPGDAARQLDKGRSVEPLPRVPSFALPVAQEPSEAPKQAARAELLANKASLPTGDEVRALVWQAGRLILAGLPAVRSTERAAQSIESQETLRTYLGDRGPVGRYWLAEIAQLLQQPYTGQDEIWSAAARALGRLGNYELSPLIAHGLDAEAFPGRVEAAREALHDLFGVWFQSDTAFEPYREVTETSRVQGLLLKRSLENERVARERLIELLGLRPSSAVEWVAAMDPAIRIAAARSVGEALNRMPAGELNREPLLAMLFSRLEKERDSRVFHALLSSLGQLTESQAFDAPEVVRLRQVLFGQNAGANRLARAQAMARLPWRLEGELGEEHVFRAIHNLGGLIHSLAESDRRRGSPDPDPMFEALLALQILCGRAASAGLGDGLRDLEMRVELLDLVRGRYYSEELRVAAADAFGAFVRPDDWPVMASVMREEAGLPALRFGVLGLMHSSLLEFHEAQAGPEELIKIVTELSGFGPDPDLRRRALSILSDPRLCPLIETLDANFLVRRLESEQVSDLALMVIGLLENFGRPEMLVACMASERFEELAADPGSLPALARMCAALAHRDRDAILVAAQRLAGVPQAGVSLGRLQQALELVASLDEGEALLLSPAGQRQICAWAWEQQVLGVSLDAAHKLDFIKRLAKVHWPRCGPLAEESVSNYLFDEPARKHLLAVLLGIEVMHLDARADKAYAQAKDAANKAYAQAAKSAAEHQGHAFSSDLLLEVSRDRARYFHGTNQWIEALEQFSFLVAQGALALPDLRTAVEIMTAIGDGTNLADISEQLFHLQRAAIEHSTWSREPLALRMKDLRELSASAMQNPGGKESEVFVELLEGLPPLPAEGQAPSAPLDSASQESSESTQPEPVWVHLVLDRGRLEELRELRQRHVQAIERMRAKSLEAAAALE